QARADGIDAVAIVFMHAWKFPEHEQKVAQACRDAGFGQVSVSHEVSPLIKLVGRGDTAVVDAYLSPILSRYVQRVAAELGIEADQRAKPASATARRPLSAAAFQDAEDAQNEGSAASPRLMFMMSSGGLTAA